MAQGTPNLKAWLNLNIAVPLQQGQGLPGTLLVVFYQINSVEWTGMKATVFKNDND
jgi:hypothetical protein